MVKLNRIITRTGDGGMTGLADGSRVAKQDVRVECYGTVDELNALLGVASAMLQGEVLARVRRIQHDLFDLGADFSTPQQEGESEKLRITEAQVMRLEAEAEEVNAQLSPLTSFILPGGEAASAWLHLARTVARRAERQAWQLQEQASLNPYALQYLNRLSDHLFLLARQCNHNGAADILWVPGKHR